MALDTVGDYILEARRLLQDEVAPHRYPELDLIQAFDIALMEARRIRPDLFLGRFGNLPRAYSADQPLEIDPMYRPTFVYYIAGRAQLRDAEGAQDQRASALMNKFVAQLLTVQS